MYIKCNKNRYKAHRGKLWKKAFANKVKKVMQPWRLIFKSRAKYSRNIVFYSFYYMYMFFVCSFVR